MSEEILYYNQMLWQHHDSQITTSFLNVEKFVSKSEYGISPPKIRINISNFKTKGSSWIVLSHQDIFCFIMKFKEFENQIGKMTTEIVADLNKQFNFSIKSKKNLIVTFLHKVEYGGICVRIVISDKTKDYLDSEKIYVSLYDFLSLMMILGQFRMNYLQVVDSTTNIVMMKELSQKIDSLNNTIHGYYSEFIQYNNAKEKLHEHQARMSSSPVPLTTEFDPFSNSPLASAVDSLSSQEKVEIIEKSEEIRKSSSSSSISEIKVLTDNLTDFIKENRDTYDIGIVDIPETKKVETNSATVISHSFTEKMLINDISNLEMYFTNIINDELSFSKFSSLVKTKLDFDPLDGISIENKNSLNYLISNYIKDHIKQNLEKKQSIPSNVVPVVIDGVTPNENKISLAYDLFLYCIYYGQLKNILKEKDYDVIANKELICFTLKTITSPYIFSIVKNIDEKLVISELINRYKKYRSDGVFDKLEKEILDNRSIKFELTETVITAEATRMYNAIVQNWNNFTIKASFGRLSNLVKLSFDDFIKNKLTDEQIKKILAAEFNFRKNGKVNFAEAGINGFDDIPLTISEKFGLTKKKFDNSNLQRFIKEKCKDNKKSLDYCLEIASKINESYRDLKSVNVDYTLIQEEILRAILLWDVEKDPKVSKSYIYYLDLIEKSTLTKDMVMSLLTNIQETNDPDFTKSFIASRDD